MNVNRRAFLFGAGAVVMAASVPINLRQRPFLWGDGVHDDTDALNAFFRGESVELSDAVIHHQKSLIGGRYLISEPIILGAGASGKVWRDFEMQMSFDGAGVIATSELKKFVLYNFKTVARCLTP